jgi:hypothetical protein
LRIASATITLVLLLLLNGTLQLNARSWDAQSDGFWGMRRVQQCESLGRAPDVLFLGSSRAVYSANASLVDSTVAQGTGAHTLSCNAGSLGSTIEQDYYTFKRLLEDGYAPKLLVENVWEQNLNANAKYPADSTAEHTEEVLWLADLSDIAQVRSHFAGGAQGVSQVADFVGRKTVPLYRDRAGVVRSLCGDSSSDICENTHVLGSDTEHIYQRSNHQGWIPEGDLPLSKLTPEQIAAKHQREADYFHGAVQNWAPGGAQPGYLARLLDLARAHSIRVAVVTSPLHPSIYNYLDKPGDWHRISDYLRGFVTAHGATYYDESHASGFTDDDFVDPHHMTPTGAAKFSTWLATAIVAPALR